MVYSTKDYEGILDEIIHICLVGKGEICQPGQSIPEIKAKVRKLIGDIKVASKKNIRVKSLKARVYERDGGLCRLCRSPIDTEVHHLTPKILGGQDVEMNMITLCNPCHHFIHYCNPMEKYGKYSQNHRELVMAGLARAAEQGRKGGRPKGSKDSRPRRKSGYYLRYAGKKTSAAGSASIDK